MKVLDEAARELMDDLLEQARVAGTLEGRLAAAIGPCAIAGGRELHLEIVRDLIEKATARASA